MIFQTLNALIILGGGQPIPAYERLILPIAQRDFAAVFVPEQGLDHDVNQRSVFERLRATPLPLHWSCTDGPSRRFPQWSLRYRGPGLEKYQLESLDVHVGIATRNGPPTNLRELYILDYPLQTNDPLPLSSYTSEAAWLTLYVYEDWQSRWKASHLVNAQLGLHGEVVGTALI